MDTVTTESMCLANNAPGGAQKVLVMITAAATHKGASILKGGVPFLVCWAPVPHTELFSSFHKTVLLQNLKRNHLLASPSFSQTFLFSNV
jgi:hypothetical protein